MAWDGWAGLWHASGPTEDLASAFGEPLLWSAPLCAKNRARQPAKPLSRNRARNLDDEQCSHLHPAERLAMEQGERGQVRQHQSTDRGTDPRQGPARRQASVAALFAGDAQWREG